ncbi:MAG: hypothetical protein RIF41_33765 [Polyangiaceae bacterium]
MSGRKTVGVTLVIAMSFVSAQAAAKAIYKPAIPNAAVNDCDTCHIPDDPNDARNLFGEEVQILVDAATPLDQWWDQLKNGDADADGQSNAEELGDPCLEWTMAIPAGRTFDISNPGDGQSLSPSPDVCEDPPMMGEGGGGDGSGSGNGDGSGNGMGNGNGTGMGEGGAEPVPSNGNDRPGDPAFTVAEPGGCASIAGRRDASWLAMALLALGLIRRRR